MRFCIDISAVPFGTGVSRYTSNLTRALYQIIATPDSLSLFGTSFRQYPQLKQFADTIDTNSHLYPFPASTMTMLFHRFGLLADTVSKHANVFHSWDWYLPKTKKTRLVTTIHDVALFKYPTIAHPEIKAHHQEVIRRIRLFKPHIITVSKATKDDVVDLFNIDPDDITVVYEALPDEVKVSPTQTYHHQKPYFLMVGTLEPRKNYHRQIEAWRQYRSDFDLIIVGKDGWDNVPMEPGIKRYQYINTIQLAQLYRSASLFLYCSLSEGFGLPILEAMYHQCPVVTSNLSSMAEIGNTACVQVDPLSVESISVGIEQALHAKDELIKQGVTRMKDFSWTKAAKETLEVYKKAIKK